MRAKKNTVVIERSFEEWIDFLKIKNYFITENKAGEKIVNVDGNVDLSDKDLEEIPIKFGIVRGNFDCSNNLMLRSLKNCPRIVMGNFDCSRNAIDDLNLLPDIIGGDLNCSLNPAIKSHRFDNCDVHGYIEDDRFSGYKKDFPKFVEFYERVMKVAWR